MFVKKFDGGDFLILLLYINDMLIVGQDPKKIESLKKTLRKSFAMKDMGPARQILWMHVVWNQTKKLLWLPNEKYVTKVRQRFTMVDAKPVGGSSISTSGTYILMWEDDPLESFTVRPPSGVVRLL